MQFTLAKTGAPFDTEIVWFGSVAPTGLRLVIGAFPQDQPRYCSLVLG